MIGQRSPSSRVKSSCYAPVERRTAHPGGYPLGPMLDPRIYRTGLVAVALAVIVLAFSLGDQQGPLTTTLAPEAFNGGHAYAAMNRIAKQFPSRRPGSAADASIATQVGTVLGSNGFSVS